MTRDLRRPPRADRIVDAGRSGFSQRFWPNVQRGPDCWLWKASLDRTGVGQFRVGNTMMRAHRVAWELVLGSPPPRLLRHGCGDLACVRPDHMIAADDQHGPKNLARTREKRFATFVDKGPDCWLWTGSVNHVGHGQFHLSVGGKRHTVGAHRVAWELANGPLPARTAVDHTCGTSRCVNPSHLTLRTLRMLQERTE